MSENLPSFKEGGILWFTNLSGPDPLYLLPTICAATFLVTVEVRFQPFACYTPRGPGNAWGTTSHHSAHCVVDRWRHSDTSLLCLSNSIVSAEGGRGKDTVWQTSARGLALAHLVLVSAHS